MADLDGKVQEKRMGVRSFVADKGGGRSVIGGGK